MNQINKEEKTWSVLIRLIVICVIALGINFMTSCEPQGCWDCNNVMVDGVITEICYEVDESYCEY